MTKTKIIPGLLVLLFFCCLALPQEEEKPYQRPLFIRATLYPTFSLARYDYNIDRNKVELRVYLNLRDGRRDGPVIPDARVAVNDETVPFDEQEKDYRKRIEIIPEAWPTRADLSIETNDGRRLSQSFDFPGWLLLDSPPPQILSAQKDLPITWTFTGYPFEVTLHAYDFKTGREIAVQRKIPPEGWVIPGDRLPDNTILRVWITPDWFYKKYLRDEGAVRGSEINIIPWSQTFLRTRFSQPAREEGP